MTLYTVARNDGDNRRINLSANEAADAVLSHDGRKWEIRREADDGFTIWVLGSTWTRTIFTTSESEFDLAITILMEQIINCPPSSNELFAETMEQYEKSLQN